MDLPGRRCRYWCTWFSGPRCFIMWRLLLQVSPPGKKCRTERQTPREEPHGFTIQMVHPDERLTFFSVSTIQSREVDVGYVQLQRMPGRSRRQISGRQPSLAAASTSPTRQRQPPAYTNLTQPSPVFLIPAQNSSRVPVNSMETTTLLPAYNRRHNNQV